MREFAIEKVKASKQITMAAAKKIVAEFKKKEKKVRPILAGRLAVRLVWVEERDWKELEPQGTGRPC
jgi:hypothetical protein